MHTEVTWDEEKNRANVTKHGLSFEEASRLFTSGVDYLELFDERHSEDEERFIALGPRTEVSYWSCGPKKTRMFCESSAFGLRPDVSVSIMRHSWENEDE